MSASILLVEDDKLFGETIVEFLEDAGFCVTHHLDASTAMESTYKYNYALYILDINLPTQNGIEFFTQLRHAHDQTPAIFLTSSTQSHDLKAAFGAGCEDYLTKPVDVDELLLRIKALLRRVYGEEKMTFGPFTLDWENRTLVKGDVPILLKPKTFLLLHLLVSHQGTIVTTEMIEERLWERQKMPSPSAIRVYVTEIKQALGGNAITNIRGIGYRFDLL